MSRMPLKQLPHVLFASASLLCPPVFFPSAHPAVQGLEFLASHEPLRQQLPPRSAVGRDGTMTIAATWLSPEAPKAKQRWTWLHLPEVSFRETRCPRKLFAILRGKVRELQPVQENGLGSAALPVHSSPTPSLIRRVFLSSKGEGGREGETVQKDREKTGNSEKYKRKQDEIYL